MDYHPQLSAGEVEQLIRKGMPAAANLQVLAVEPGRARCRIPVTDAMRRPGGTVSGPLMFTAADAAMYAVILAHVGPKLLAVTTDASIHFLRKPELVDIIADARLLKLGKRLVVCHVEVFSDGRDLPVATATGSYSLPD
ncbi:MAG: PaaI family thioesterase [Parahaliea sp.]